MPPRRRSPDTRGRFGRYPPLTKIPRANKSDVAETRAREPRGPVERICRSGNIRPGGYIGAVCGNFAAPFRPPLPWASEAALAKLQGIRIRYRARRHTIHGCGCHLKPLPPPRCRQRQSKRSWCMAITSRRGLDGQKAPLRRPSRFRGESGRGESLSGSFLGREGPQKSTPYPGFKLEFKKHTSNPKMQLRTRGGFLNLKSKLHLDFTNVPHAVH